MIWLIAMLFGCNDIALLLSISFSNATMNILGLFQEKYNNIRDPKWKVDWYPFILGCFIGSCEWVVIFTYVLGSQLQVNSTLPGFVWGILIGYVIFFNTFRSICGCNINVLVCGKIIFLVNGVILYYH